MPISEAARADLYTGLSEVLGRERAETLMAYLPTFDPIDVATKTDVAELRAALEARMDGLRQEMEARFQQMEARFQEMEARFQQMEARFQEMEARFQEMEARFGVVDERFELMGGRFDLVDQRLDDMARHFESIDGHLFALGRRIDRLYYILVTGVFAIIAAMAGLSAFGG